jgi:glucose 1-dehydrogenase
MDLSGKVAMVTGACRGIGRAIALEMAKSGASVALNCLREDEDSHETEGMLRATGRHVLVCYGDVSDYRMLESNVGAVVENFGRLDIAVANAAYSEREMFCSADLNAFRHTVNVTMWGAFHLFRVAANQMISQGNGGALLAVSSPHAYIPVPGAMAYNMAKAAVDQMARTAAVELAEHRIRVNILYPGWTDTPGERRFNDEEQMAKLSERLLWKRLARPEEIARAAVFLCDPTNDYVSGSSLVVDAAQSLARLGPTDDIAVD